MDMNEEIVKAQSKIEVLDQILSEADKLDRVTTLDLINIIGGVREGLRSHINGIGNRILNANSNNWTNE